MKDWRTNGETKTWNWIENEIERGNKKFLDALIIK